MRTQNHINVTANINGYFMMINDNITLPCVVGEAGIGNKQGEGDNITPIGCYPMRYLYYRHDHIDEKILPKNQILCTPLTPQDGWCDDPKSPLYNQHVTLPFTPSHEKLYRNDYLYNMMIVLGYNDDPVIAGKGSAIFIHLARQENTPTAGCIALNYENFLQLLPFCATNQMVNITKGEQS